MSTVSIHAPAWGATNCQHSSRCILVVSIHAPAWGATISADKALGLSNCRFRSTLPHGERPRCTPQAQWELVSFRSTLPHGERHEIKHNRWHRSSSSFDPRSRMGSDQTLLLSHLGNCEVVSIHAPAWGATRRKDTIGRLNNSFNPRSRMGSDPSRK